MTNFPLNHWLRIVEYRDFIDVPHLVLAADESGGRWIVDHRMLLPQEDFHECALLFGPVTAESFQGNWSEQCVVETLVGAVPFAAVEFDESKRARICVRGQIQAVSKLWSDFRDEGDLSENTQ